MNIAALKQRKKTVNIIYRSSCAMKAATVVRVRQVEKCLNTFLSFQSLIKEHNDEMFETIWLYFINQNWQNKAHIIITCDKGMCGDLINIFNKYMNLYSNNESYWFILGAKFESFANEKNKFFLGKTFLDQINLFKAANAIYDFLVQKEICELNIHYFSKDKIMKKTIFSKENIYQALLNNQNASNEIVNNENNVDKDYALLFLANEIYQAMLSSLLAENKQRIIAMTQAKTNAQDMDKILDRLYNKARQEKITTELSENIVEI
jgi:F-type H+-transporting ATPase subunit gamma